MIPKALFKGMIAQVEETLIVHPNRRGLIQAYFDEWLVKAALANPGPWVETVRPRLASLAKSINLELHDGVLDLTSATSDEDMLTLLARGSRWFDGVDQLELQIVRVITSTNRNLSRA